jgi:hypothetical protein
MIIIPNFQYFFLTFNLDICPYLSDKSIMFKHGFITVLSINCNFLESKELIIESNALVVQIVDNIIFINEFQKKIRI